MLPAPVPHPNASPLLQHWDVGAHHSPCFKPPRKKPSAELACEGWKGSCLFCARNFSQARGHSGVSSSLSWPREKLLLPSFGFLRSWALISSGEERCSPLHGDMVQILTLAPSGCRTEKGFPVLVHHGIFSPGCWGMSALPWWGIRQNLSRMS